LLADGSSIEKKEPTDFQQGCVATVLNWSHQKGWLLSIEYDGEQGVWRVSSGKELSDS